jgi:hypothetical protein
MRRLPGIITAGAAAALLVYGSIPQPAEYHAFADQRPLLGVPNGGDVLSNVGFAIVGLWGARRLWRSRDGLLAGRSGYAVFFAALVLTAAGSAFYHLSPDNSRLVWDRLPIALACAGLLAAVRTESQRATDDPLFTAGLVIAAVASVAWWHATETLGRGDLRPYLLLQAAPLVLVPVWQAVHGAPIRRRLAFGAAIVLYVAGKLAELGDAALFSALTVASGHTLKHLFATAAAAVVTSQVGATRPRPVP